MWGRLLSTALGLWLMAAPAVLGYGAPASTVDRIAGPIAAAAAWISAWSVTRPVRWVNLPLGLALAVASLVLGYPPPALANSLVVGLALAALAFVGRRTPHRFGGGWASLLPGHEPAADEPAAPGSTPGA